jgi:hypothetical protein
MTRLMRQRPGASRALHAIVAALLLGALASALPTSAGGVLYGLTLTALGAWLASFDIARRTVPAEGLSRYMAVCLLIGYAMAVRRRARLGRDRRSGCRLRDAAAAWTGPRLSLQHDARPCAGHPALRSSGEASLRRAVLPAPLPPSRLAALRLVAAPSGRARLAAGAAGNALALAVFAAVVAGSAIAWRLRRPPAHAASSHRAAAQG